MTDRAFGYDHKTEWLENEKLRQEGSITNWIYIGVDTERVGMAKIGLTTGSLGTRSSGSQNPFYALLYAFKIKEGVAPSRVAVIECSVKSFLSESYECITHQTSGRASEWFCVSPQEMRKHVHDFLYDNFSWEMHCYHCYIRDIGVIYSWENPKFLKGKLRPQYQANDLSSPPVDPNCLMPGGCGEDCEC